MAFTVHSDKQIADIEKIGNIHTDGVRVRLLENSSHGAAGDIVILSLSVARDLISNCVRDKDGSVISLGQPRAELAE